MKEVPLDRADQVALFWWRKAVVASPSLDAVSRETKGMVDAKMHPTIAVRCIK